MASQSPPPVEAFLLTDVGRKRPHNEDYIGYFVPEDPQELAANGQLFALADGVGGAAAGEVASQYAVRKVLHDCFESAEPDLERRLVTAIPRPTPTCTNTRSAAINRAWRRPWSRR